MGEKSRILISEIQFNVMGIDLSVSVNVLFALYLFGFGIITRGPASRSLKRETFVCAGLLFDVNFPCCQPQ